MCMCGSGVLYLHCSSGIKELATFSFLLNSIFSPHRRVMLNNFFSIVLILCLVHYCDVMSLLLARRVTFYLQLSESIKYYTNILAMPSICVRL